MEADPKPVDSDAEPEKSAEPASVVYYPAVVTFFDVLGFRNLVRTKKAAEILKIVELFQYTHDLSAGPYLAAQQTNVKRFAVFSDSAVRIAFVDPLSSQAAGVVALQEVISCVYIQLELLRHRVLIRGGMATGDVFFGGTKLFGPALIEAYDLESKRAVYPRIVVSDRTLAALKGDNFSDAFCDRSVRTAADGVSYIDYLRSVCFDYVDFGEYLDLLWDHRTWVIELLSQGGVADGVREKHLWLATYHDRLIKLFSQVILRKSAMKVEEMMIPPEMELVAAVSGVRHAV